MARATSRIYFGIRNPLHAAILLLQVLSLVSLVQCYRDDVSRGRQLVRGLVAVAREENPSTFSRRRKRRGAGTEEGIALKVEGRSAPIECKAGLLCPANSSCMTKGELAYCCEKGKLCPEPVDCLGLDDSQCDNHSGQLITDLRDGKVKNCCYAGYEICATFLGFPSCMPVTRTSLLASDTAQSPHTIQANSTSNSSSTGSGTLIGGLVGGAIGLVIVGICVSYTASYYRQKLLEEKEAELNMWEDDESGVMGIRGGGSSGPSSSSGSSSRQSTGSWMGSYPVSSWSKSTLSDIHPGLENHKEIAVMELENMSSSRGRFYTTNSGMGSKMPVLDTPLATATYRGVSKPFDWRSCQPLYPLLTSAAPQAQEPPPERKPCLPWLPLDLSLIPTSSPIIGPWLESRRSTVAFDHRMSQRLSQRLSFRLDMPMPPTPRLEGKVPTRMSGALSSSSDGLDSLSPIIQKPPNALLASPMPMI